MFDLSWEYALIKFSGKKFSGKLVPELLDLAERGIVRFVDIVFIQKAKNGSVRTIKLSELEPAVYEMFVPMGRHVPSFLVNDELDLAASKLPRNSAAALFLWENLYIDNLHRATLDVDGQLLESGQIAPEVVKQFKKELAAQKRKNCAMKKSAEKE
jgi:hypothetical protein